MAGDDGNNAKVALETDSVSRRGPSLRRKCDMWHPVAVGAGVFHGREATIRKIPRVSEEADELL